MKIQTFGIPAATLISALWLSGQAVAQNAPPPSQGGRAAMMKQADTDGDGRISRAEAEAHHNKRFTEIDEDGDGNVSREVFVSKKTDKIMRRMSREGIEERVGKRFDRIDQDGDHVLSLSEFSAKSASHFDRMDKDGDGFLSAGEGPRHGFHRKPGGPR